MKATRYRFRGSVVGVAILIVLFISALGLAQSLVYAQALSSESGGTPFDKNKVLADSDFVMSGTMSVESIQRFLADHRSSLAELSDAGKSAAQLIYDAGRKSRVNPQLLLTLTLMRPDTSFPAILNQDIDQLIGRPEAYAKTFGEQIDQDAQLLRGYYDIFATLGASLDDPMAVSDGTVKPRNAATAALYSFLPWIGEPSDRQQATGVNLFHQLWAQWFEVTSSGATQGACPTITPADMVQTVTGLIIAGGFRDYCFMASAGQEYLFSTCPPEGTADFDTILDVRNADGSMILATEDDSPGCGLLTRLTWTAPAAGQYRVRVRGFAASAGSYTLGYRLFQPPSCTFLSPPQSSFQEVRGLISSGQFEDYCFTATEGVIYNFTTCDPGSANFDTIIELRNFSGSTVLAANDDFCGLQSNLTWQAPSSGQFRVRMRGYGSASGSFTMAYRTLPPIPCINITPGSSYQMTAGTLVPSGFKDYCFDAAQGTTYEFTTCAPGTSSGPMAIDIRTASSSRSLPVAARGGCGAVPGQQVLFTAPSAGAYRARMISGASGANFTLAHRIFQTDWVTNAPVPVTNGLSQPTAVASGGMIYVIGGGVGPGPDARINQVWAYDPKNDAWARKADIPVAAGISAFGAAAEIDGYIYVFGGVAGGGAAPSVLNTTWIYDVANNVWDRGANMPGTRFGSAVAAIGGKIYVAGGADLTAAYTTLWEYDPDADTFTVKAPLPAALARIHGGAVTVDGMAEMHIFAGGFDGANHLAYNVANNMWRTRAPMPFGVTDPGVVAMTDHIYVVGGLPLARTQIYDPSADTWMQGSLIPAGVNNTSAASYLDFVYMIGGFNGSNSVPSNYSLEVKP